MKTTLLLRNSTSTRVWVLLPLVLTCFALSPAAQTPGTKIEGKTQDEAAIRKLMEDLAVAWNKHDVVSYSMVFAKDADFTNWRGTVRIHGREEKYAGVLGRRIGT